MTKHFSSHRLESSRSAGKAATKEGGKENSQRMKSKNNGKPNTCMIIFTHKAFNRPAVNIVCIHPQWVELRKLNKILFKE